jgi:outer membrane protein OmpA-like peptidoglycan-associated protein
LLDLPAEEDPNDPLALILRIHDDNLQFDVNKSILKPNGKAFLKTFIPTLITSLASPQFCNDIASILIEGHTDSDGNDELNLRLSQDRSFEVLMCALNESTLDARKREYLLRVGSTNGMGERDLIPVGCIAGRENKAQSRRVEFKIRVKSYEQKKHNGSDAGPGLLPAATKKIVPTAPKTTSILLNAQ